MEGKWCSREELQCGPPLGLGEDTNQRPAFNMPVTHLHCHHLFLDAAWNKLRTEETVHLSKFKWHPILLSASHNPKTPLLGERERDLARLLLNQTFKFWFLPTHSHMMKAFSCGGATSTGFGLHGEQGVLVSCVCVCVCVWIWLPVSLFTHMHIGSLTHSLHFWVHCEPFLTLSDEQKNSVNRLPVQIAHKAMFAD